MRNTRKLLWSLLGCAAGVSAAWLVLPRTSGAADRESPRFKASVVSWDDARVHNADWGEMRTYFRGESFGTKDVLTAVAVIEPGKAIHNAHRHAEEEYLVIVQGQGRWHLDGKELPAERGDILYVDPWVYHGVTNTGDEPLVFVVVKYNGKGVQLPPRPNDGRKDEL